MLVLHRLGPPWSPARRSAMRVDGELNWASKSKQRGRPVLCLACPWMGGQERGGKYLTPAIILATDCGKPHAGCMSSCLKALGRLGGFKVNTRTFGGSLTPVGALRSRLGLEPLGNREGSRSMERACPAPKPWGKCEGAGASLPRAPLGGEFLDGAFPRLHQTPPVPDYPVA